MKISNIITALILMSPIAAGAQSLTPEQNSAATLGQQIGLLSYEAATLRAQIMRLQQENAELKAQLAKEHPSEKK